MVNACTPNHILRALDLLVAEIQGAMTVPSFANVGFSGIFECGISKVGKTDNTSSRINIVFIMTSIQQANILP